MSSIMLLRRHILPCVRQVATSFVSSLQQIPVSNKAKIKIFAGTHIRLVQTTTSQNDKDKEDEKDTKINELKNNNRKADRVKPERKPFPPSFMLPDLHEKIVAQLTADGVSPIPVFEHEGTAENATKKYITRVMGHFWCTNTDCENNW